MKVLVFREIGKFLPRILTNFKGLSIFVMSMFLAWLILLSPIGVLRMFDAYKEYQHEERLLDCIKNARQTKYAAAICGRYWGPDKINKITETKKKDEKIICRKLFDKETCENVFLKRHHGEDELGISFSRNEKSEPVLQIKNLHKIDQLRNNLIERINSLDRTTENTNPFTKFIEAEDERLLKGFGVYEPEK